MLTADYLRESLDYDPESGVFTWRERPASHFETLRAMGVWNTKFARKIAGSVKPDGYVIIKVNGRFYGAHRLAWLHIYGKNPFIVDHINRDPGDNRISNLRDVGFSENTINSLNRSDNTSGVKGVTWHAPAQKWQARICLRGKRISLGMFSDLMSAKKARENAEAELYGFIPGKTIPGGANG
ncbi:HNH endonuclease [Pantoea anthophila]|uniref:HNH endonuclease n=1 Tax=Pantoea anthophila TaxID=470931 RepID=UPI002DBF5BE2|nr:HNH endonuclease [Pantoea anthophila]MEB5707390.1 HNH endonuclease [Pantoea anthophila]MEB6518261.1 HNH endonuclease [Pantoea anthophila]